MITAALTAAITAILGFFGVHASIGQIAAIAVGAKIVVVLTGVLVGSKLMKRRQAAEAKASEPKIP